MDNQIVLNDKRTCCKIILFLNSSFLLYNIISIFIDLEYIEKNILFYHYIITLTSIFLSTFNDASYEYTYYTNYGRVFASIEEFTIWKKENKSYSKYLLKCIEYICLITFLYSSLSIGIYIKENNFTKLYLINIFLLQLLAMFIIFIIAVYILFFIGMILAYPITPYNNNVVKETIITVKIDNPNEECSICLDTNNKVWIKTKCNHAYHEECFKDWIQISKSCPICREQL